MPRHAAALLLAAATPLCMGLAQAQGYPSKPVRIVTASPGAPTDVLPRLVQPKLAEYLGQPVLVENRPASAGGVLIAGEVARTAPDGHTLLSTADILSVAHHLVKDVPYEGLKAFAPVKMLASAPPVLAVNPAFPAKTLPEFIAYARANPGKVTQGAAAAGSRGHIAAAVLESELGLRLTHVPYKAGGPLPLAIVSGDVNAAFLQSSAVAQFVRAGKIRLLAVAGRTRLREFPDVPTVAELMPGFEVVAWYGVFAPAQAPKDVVARLYKEFTRALALPEVREKIAGMNLETDPRSPEEFGAFIQGESNRFGKVIRQYNIRVD